MDVPPSRKLTPAEILGQSNPDVMQMMFLQFDYDQIVGMLETNPKLSKSLNNAFWINKIIKEIGKSSEAIQIVKSMQNYGRKNLEEREKMRKEIEDIEEAIRNLDMRDIKYDDKVDELISSKPKLSKEDKYAMKLEAFFMASVDRCQLYYVVNVIKIYPFVLYVPPMTTHILKALNKSQETVECIENVLSAIDQADRNWTSHIKVISLRKKGYWLEKDNRLQGQEKTEPGLLRRLCRGFDNNKLTF